MNKSQKISDILSTFSGFGSSGETSITDFGENLPPTLRTTREIGTDLATRTVTRPRGSPQDGAACYEGQFRCDHRDGLGVETWTDGSCSPVLRAVVDLRRRPGERSGRTGRGFAGGG